MKKHYFGSLGVFFIVGFIFFILTVTIGSGMSQEALEQDSSTSEPIRLLKTGVYHGNEVHARHGEKWLGLFKEGEGFELRSVTIAVESVRDELLDEETPNKESLKTGKQISLQNEASEPIILFKNAPALHAGPVQTSRSSFTPFFTANHSIKTQSLSLNSSNTLLVDTISTPRSTAKQLMLTLIEGDRAQMLNIPPLFSNQRINPGLIWVGDLDGDGYLDFIMDLSHHYNVSRLSLFLSSQATPGNFVKKVAEWITTGC